MTTPFSVEIVIEIFCADIIEPIDPFRINQPAYLGLGAGAFIGAILIASLLIDRPWCHFFCPFGLAGRLAEKISLVKVSVNFENCSDICDMEATIAWRKQLQSSSPEGKG